MLLMQPILSVKNVSKTYASGFRALEHVNLDIRRGEIFALLGPNGAGKTTLISIICGIVTLTEGTVTVAGYDIGRDFRVTRSMIGLVPQELTTDAFETVWATVSFSRGLFGKPRNPDYIAKVLKELSLWDRKDSKIMTLSGGMKRRVLIAKALSLEADGSEIIYTYDTQGERTGITALLKDLNLAGIRFRDLHTTQSSLEDIFVDLVRQRQ